MSNYYTPVSDKTFAEIKLAAKTIWEHPNFGYHPMYVEEKLRVLDIHNIKDNYAHIICQLDFGKQAALAGLLSEGAKQELYERLDDALWGGRVVCNRLGESMSNMGVSK